MPQNKSYVVIRHIPLGRQYLDIVEGQNGLEPFWTDIKHRARLFTMGEALALMYSLAHYTPNIQAIPYE